jgi:hypothetical protein
MGKIFFCCGFMGLLRINFKNSNSCLIYCQ